MFWKRFFRVICAVLAVILVTGAAVYVWQKDNIDAVINSFLYSEEELVAKQNESKEQVKQLVKDYDISVQRDFTPEEEEMLEKGELTPEEAVELLFQKKEEQSPPNTLNPNLSGNKNQTSGKKAKTEKDVIDKYMIQFYACKADFLSRLGGLEATVLAHFRSLPERTVKTKQETISKFISSFAALESECDGKMNGILASFEKELKEVGGDTSLVSKIKKAYVAEKNAKKATIISEYA